MNAPVNAELIRTGRERESCPFHVHHRWCDVHASPEQKIGEIKIAKAMTHFVQDTESEVSTRFESVDLIMWNNKKYRAKPLLCEADYYEINPEGVI